MALVTTTLSSAVAAGDRSIVVASATSVAAGRLVLIDGEMMQVGQSYSSGTTVPVLRGRNGTKTAAHAVTANVVHGAAADFDVPATATQVSYPPAGRARPVVSYTAAGAITLPNSGEDMVAVLNGTSVLAMTIADPGKDLDGCLLWVLSNGTAAHTLTLASGVGGEGSSYDVITQNSGGPCAYVFVACNGFWLMPIAPAMTGTVTNITAGIA